MAWVVGLLTIAAGISACSSTPATTGHTTTTAPSGITFTVTSPSMEPTLKVGDRILVETNGPPGALHRGSIIVLHEPKYFPCAGGGQSQAEIVKRVIGLPDETILSKGNTIYVNGKALREPGWYNPSGAQVTVKYPVIRTVIPARHYYVMGDNRADSCDSRSFGVIPLSSVVGTVVRILNK